MATIDLFYCCGKTGEDFARVLVFAVQSYLYRELLACSNANDQKTIASYIYCVRYTCTNKGNTIEFEGGIDRSLVKKEKAEEDSALLDKLDMNIEKTASFALTEEIYSLMELSDVQDRVAEYFIPEIENKLATALGGAT